MQNKKKQYSGAIFYEDEFDLERDFIATVESINSEGVNNFEMLPLIRRVSETDGSMILQREGLFAKIKFFLLTRIIINIYFVLAACDLIDNGVLAIFGPSAKADSGECRCVWQRWGCFVLWKAD